MSTVLGILLIGGLLVFAVYMLVGIINDIKKKRARKKSNKEEKP